MTNIQNSIKKSAKKHEASQLKESYGKNFFHFYLQNKFKVGFKALDHYFIKSVNFLKGCNPVICLSTNETPPHLIFFFKKERERCFFFYF